MATAYSPTLVNLALQDGLTDAARPPFGRLLLVSLVMHVTCLVLVGSVQFSDPSERPLVAHEVSLVSLAPEREVAARASRPVVPSKVEEPRTQEPSKPQALPPAKAAPPPPVTVEPPAALAAVEPPPKPTPTPRTTDPGIREARVRSEALMRQALDKIKLPSYTPPAAAPEMADPPEGAPLKARAGAPKLLLAPPPSTDAAVSSAEPLPETSQQRDEIALPPPTPKFSRLTPAPTAVPTAPIPMPELGQRETQPLPPPERQAPQSKPLRENLDSVLKRLTVPEIPAAKPRPPDPRPDVRPRTLQPIPQPERKPSLREDLTPELRAIEELHRESAPALREETSTASARSEPRLPATSIRAQDDSGGSSAYLAEVKIQIDSHWVAPPVDLPGRPLSAVIRFRLHRSGAVSGVEVERTSGNPYYDRAAMRAVLSASPLPAFPEGLLKPYLDTHFTFAMEEPIG